MSDIYSTAKVVHVWLGEGDVATWTALRVVRDLYNIDHHICQGGAACRCHGTRHALDFREFQALHHGTIPWGPTEIQRAVFSAHTKDDIRSELAKVAGTLGISALGFANFMSHVFSNPWFRRVWVLQEALLARETLVHCGEERVPWKELVQTSDRLARSPPAIHSVPHITMPSVWSVLRQDDGGQVVELELLDLFMHGLEMRATDPRDKLFALLSLAKGTRKGTNVPVAIRSSYEKPPEQVFADFTVWWIREHRSLSILSRVHSHRDRTWQRLRSSLSAKARLELSWPTWAIGYEGQAKCGRMTLDVQFDFRAAAESVPDKRLLDQALANPHDLSLRLKGFELTTIRRLLRPELERLQNIKEPRLFQVFEALFDAWGRHARTWNSKFKGLDWVEPPSKSSATMSDHARTHANWERQQPQDRLPTCIDQFLFEAENGSIGMCPWTAEPGDVIVILHGGNVPYLLRPAATNIASGPEGELLFHFIGECFVVSAMDGLLFKVLEGNGVEARTFTLI